jgi:hypothetical protein
MIDLVLAAESVNTIVELVEGGALESTLADLGLIAAKDALSKVPHAEDKRAQVWSAVNHLEEADSVLRTTLQTRGKRLANLNEVGLQQMIEKRRYLIGLMAVCYRYLGERALTERALSAIPGADEGCDALIYRTDWEIKDFRITDAFVLGNFISPAFYKSLFGGEALGTYDYDIPSFSRSLMATWGSGPPDLLRFPGLPD